MNGKGLALSILAIGAIAAMVAAGGENIERRTLEPGRGFYTYCHEYGPVWHPDDMNYNKVSHGVATAIFASSMPDCGQFSKDYYADREQYGPWPQPVPGSYESPIDLGEVLGQPAERLP